MSRNILFLTLRVFSATGGIEKVCKILGKVLVEIYSEKAQINIFSSHDSSIQAHNNPYFSDDLFTGFSNNRIKFLLNSIKKGKNADVIIISHVNILPVAWMIKKLFFNKKLIMFAHGIEMWSMPLGYKKKMLAACDEIICVSEFTKHQISKILELKKVKLSVINNCIDPFLINEKKNIELLRKRYGINSNKKLMFTLTRMDASERYKGYDRVIEAMSHLTFHYPELIYMIGGAYDEDEKKYVNNLLQKFNINDKVILTGFINNEEICDHFMMSDFYIMPSTGEGFGIVFIEAMYFGLPVIAGNLDGSIDAVLNGKLGLLIDPLNMNELINAISAMMKDLEIYKPNINILMDNFGYESYKNKIQSLFLNYL
jgi:glycosyltransferase involved in cell wall biosynthesis